MFTSTSLIQSKPATMLTKYRAVACNRSKKGLNCHETINAKVLITRLGRSQRLEYRDAASKRQMKYVCIHSSGMPHNSLRSELV